MGKITKKEYAEDLMDIAFNEIPLDDEERIAFDKWKNVSQDDIVEIPEKEKNQILKDVRKAQRDYKAEFKKNVVLNIRINNGIVEKIKQKALATGLNYQSYINAVLYQIAYDRINIEVKGV
jgi:predicted DNA binding CopG/RHH family protein